MPKHADTSSKRLFAGDPETWIRFIFPGKNIQVGKLLTLEFQWIQRQADFLLKAYHPTAGEFILLCEVQLYYELHMPLRVQAYSALAEEKYKLPIYPVLINILPPSKGVTIPTYHERQFLGLYTRRDYQVINLWEIDAEMVLEQYSPSLVPLVPVMRGGDNEHMLLRAIKNLQEHTNKDEMEVILGLFASMVMDHEIITRYVRWNMSVLQDSPLLQQIIEEGKQEWVAIGQKEGIAIGRKEGLAIGQKEGIAIGQSKGQIAMLQRILTNRFGNLPSSLVEQLHQCSIEQLERLADEVLVAETLEDFLARAHLPTVDSSETRETQDQKDN
jgi:predicted transposase YdaD